MTFVMLALMADNMWYTAVGEGFIVPKRCGSRGERFAAGHW